MTTMQAIRKALNELGTDAVCRDIQANAEKTLGRKIAKDEFFRTLDRVMDEIKGRAGGTGDQPTDGKEVA